MTSRADRARAAATLAGYRGGWAVLRTLPEGAAARSFERGADLAWRRNGKGVQRLRSNLRRVVGPDIPGDDLDHLVRQGMRSYARYWKEVFRPQTYDRERILRHTVVEGWEFLSDVIASGRGVILTLPHCASYDAAGAWIAAKGVSATAVAERLEPEELFEEFVEFRRRNGLEIIPHAGGEAPPYGQLVDRLDAGGVVALVAERDLSRSGVPVEFFGATATMPAGPAALSIDTGAALIPVDLWFTPRGWGLRVARVIPVPPDGTRAERIQAMTQDFARDFEAAIRHNPEDWHMLQRLWLEDLDPAKAPGAHAPGPAAPDVGAG